MNNKAQQARQAVLNFQNKKGLVSPENAAKNLVGIINGMGAKLSELQTEKAVLLSYLMPNSPNVLEINMQIVAIKTQIRREKAKLTSPSGKTLNKVIEEYERLEMNAEFAQDIYKSAIQSLELGRIEAARTLKKMSVLQHPTTPEYPLKPTRLYKITVFILCILLVTGIVSLLTTIIRDHHD
jgi:capsular polysaccharide transport system permease protein